MTDQQKLRALVEEGMACEKEVEAYKALFEAAVIRADSGATRVAEGRLLGATTRWMEAKAATYALARRMMD